MATFPAIAPSTLEPSPGARPVAISKAYSGATSTTVADTVLVVGGTLALSFSGLSEAQANSIRNHCRDQAGALFQFSTTTLAAGLTPTGYGWTYADPAQVEDIRAVAGSEFYVVSCTFQARRLRRAVPPSFAAELWIRTTPGLALQPTPSFTAALNLTTQPGVFSLPLWVPTALDLWFENPSSQSSWVDQAYSRELVQATSGQQPALNSTGLNGGPILTFDGVNDVMVCADAGASGVQNISIFLVVRYNSPANSEDLIAGVGTYGALRAAYRNPDNQGTKQGFGTWGNDILSSSLDCDIGGSFHIWSFVQSGVNVLIDRDGVTFTDTLASTPATLSSARAFMGGIASDNNGFAANISVAAWLVEYRAVSTADQKKYQGYLADRYWRQRGASVPLASDHPYYSAPPTL